jgi:hypothetical protein
MEGQYLNYLKETDWCVCVCVCVCVKDSSNSGQSLVVGFCEHGNEPWGLIKCGEKEDEKWINDFSLKTWREEATWET